MTLLNILLDATNTQWGFGTIDSYLYDLIKQTKNFASNIDWNFVGVAKAIGGAACLIVVAMECYMMMMGKRAIDVLKLLRIIGISIAISFSGTITQALDAIGTKLAEATESKAMAAYEHLKNAESEALAESTRFGVSNIENGQKLEQQKKAKEEDLKTGSAAQEESGFWDSVGDAVNSVVNLGSQVIVSVLQVVVQMINTILRWISILLFQVFYYGLLVGNVCFLSILAAWAPVSFALSLIPAYKSAWVQWLSKYLSVAMWPFVANWVVAFSFSIFEYGVTRSKMIFQQLNNSANAGESIANLLYSIDGQIAAIVIYILGVLIGAYLLSMVPEVASWLIPGGTSSGFNLGSKGVGVVTTATSGGASGMAKGGKAVLSSLR